MRDELAKKFALDQVPADEKLTAERQEPECYQHYLGPFFGGIPWLPRESIRFFESCARGRSRQPI
jgi:hypothetical protein